MSQKPKPSQADRPRFAQPVPDVENLASSQTTATTPSINFENQTYNSTHTSTQERTWIASTPPQPADLSPDDLLRGRDLLLKQTAWARQYTRQLIDSIPEELWYVQPSGLKTHVAWQVGHLAVSQYGLMLFRQRGRMPGDLELMPGWLRKQFGRGTTPSESAEGMPTPTDLLAMLDKINAQSHAEVAC
jgi:hypothetical protein